MPKMFSTSTMFKKKTFFAHENMKKPASKFAKSAQIQLESQFRFHKNLPLRDLSIMTLNADHACQKMHFQTLFSNKLALSGGLCARKRGQKQCFHQCLFSCLRKLSSFQQYILLQCIYYSHWVNGARNEVISIGRWGVFYFEKGAICQSHLAA